MKQVRHEKLEKVAEGGEGITAWLVGLALFGAAILVIFGGIWLTNIPQATDDGAAEEGPNVQALVLLAVVVIAAAVTLAGQAWLLVIAFKSSLLHGLLCMTPYQLYFVITRWDDCKSPFLLSLVSALISSVVYLAFSQSVSQ